MDQCLTFLSEAAAIVAEKQIWVNIIKDIVLDQDVIDLEGNIWEDLSGMDDSQISQLRIKGVREGFLADNGNTISYSYIYKVHEGDKWYLPKPPPALMTGVIDYQIETFSNDWLPETL